MSKKNAKTTTSLRDAVIASREAKAPTSVGTNGQFPRTPAGYNRQHNQCILDMISHENPTVRLAVLSNDRCPAKMLRDAMETEQDPTVLRAMLLSPRITEKAIMAFMKDPRCEQFAEDTELEEHLVARVKASA